MTKEIIIILLLLALIYLYYQNRKLKGLPATAGSSETIFEVGEDKEELIAEKDLALRQKNEAEQEVLSLSNQLRNKQSEVTHKETEIERLKKEKSQSEISLNKKISEKNGLITTLQREINQQKEKYSKQGQLLDTEQLENNKLTEENEKLQEQIAELQSEKAKNIPGSWETASDQVEELERKHQEQLKTIYSLLNPRNEMTGDEKINFGSLCEQLKGVVEEKPTNPFPSKKKIKRNKPRNVPKSESSLVTDEEIRNLFKSPKKDDYPRKTTPSPELKPEPENKKHISDDDD